MDNDIIRRLAISQARGVNQLSLINELVTWAPVSFEWYEIPTYGNPSTRVYGVTRLQHRSWKSVKARLVAVGFVIEESRESMTIQLHFPEAP